jgi:hypothetical protein
VPWLDAAEQIEGAQRSRGGCHNGEHAGADPQLKSRGAEGRRQRRRELHVRCGLQREEGADHEEKWDRD